MRPVPPEWTVQQGHELLERLEADIRRALPPTAVFTHLEPLGSPSEEPYSVDAEFGFALVLRGSLTMTSVRIG